MRTPISRVRSVTETSMMFIMPIPPTVNEMAAMPISGFRIRKAGATQQVFGEVPGDELEP